MNKKRFNIPMPDNYWSKLRCHMIKGIFAGLAVWAVLYKSAYENYKLEKIEIAANIAEVKPETLHFLLPEPEIIFPDATWEDAVNGDSYQLTVRDVDALECDAYIERAIILGFEHIRWDISDHNGNILFGAHSSNDTFWMQLSYNPEKRRLLVLCEEETGDKNQRVRSK